MTKNGRKHIVLPLLIALLTCGIGAWSVFAPEKLNDTPAQTHTTGDDFIRVSGLNEADHIAYKTLKNKDTIAGVDIEIIRKNTPLDISVIHNPKTQSLAVSGAGAPAFSDITIARGSKAITAKSDWAGLFHMDDTRAIQGNNQKKEPIRLSFYSANTMRDSGEFLPLTVDIFIAEHGGGPDKDRTNVYDTEFCGDPPLSVCIEPRMRRQIRNILDNYITAFMMMTEQLSAVMMQYVTSIGMFMDAKNQMETQRKQQELVAQAHKDYHPSEQMCRFGSYMKSVAKSERKKAHDLQAINKTLMESYLNVVNSNTATINGKPQEATNRLRQFREVYCDPADNSFGMDLICQHDPSDLVVTQNEGIGASDAKRVNKDIDYARTAELPLTFDIDFMDATKTNDEEDVIALAKNLYWPRAIENADGKAIAEDYPVYMDFRRMVALQNLAHNSFAHYMASKSASPKDSTDSGTRYMKSLLKEMGLSNTEIDEFLGRYPSYYAQMDFMTKQIYQNPDFYTDLIDKPVNVQRIGVTLDAIKLMQMRDMHDASLRREMLTSGLIEEALELPFNVVNRSIQDATRHSLTRQ